MARAFILILIATILFIFYPTLVKGQVPISANLLVSFYNPWSKSPITNWTGGVPNKPVGIDDLRIFYPQRAFSTEQFRDGQLPLWNPYSYSGNYLTGLSESAVFYPLFFLFMFVPQIPAWTFLVMLQPFLAGLGTFLFLRLITEKYQGAIFGGIVFGFSGVMLVRMVEGISVGHTFLWLPFTFYAIESFLQKNKLRYLFVLLFSLAFSLLAGWFQFTFYIIVFSFFYALFRTLQMPGPFFNVKRLLLFSPYIFLPLITLFHILPAFEAFSNSPRGALLNTNIQILHLMPIQHLLTFLFPDFFGNPAVYSFFGKSEYKESILYIGVIPFVLSLFSFTILRKNRIVAFFSLCTIIFLILGTDSFISRSLLLIKLPIVSSFLPNRIFALSAFSLAILSAFGIEELLHKQKSFMNKKLLIVLAIILLTVSMVDICIGIGLYSIKHLQQITPEANLLVHAPRNTISLLGLSNIRWQFFVQERNVIIPQVFFFLFLIIYVVCKKIKKDIILFASIVLLTLIGQIYFAQKYIPFSEKQFVFPNNPVLSTLQSIQKTDRFVTTDEGDIQSNIPLYFHLNSSNGVGSMYPKAYEELLSYVDKSTQNNFTSRIEVRFSPTSRKIFVEQNPYYLRFMQLDGIKYVVKLKKEQNKVDRFTTNGTSLFPLVWQNDTWQIFRYNQSVPRYFLTNKFTIIPNTNQLFQKLFSIKSDPKTLLFSDLPKQFRPNQIPRIVGNVSLVQYTPNQVEFRTTTKTDAFLYLSDTYTPSFRATIDGKTTPIFPAQHAFRAVFIPKGTHTIIMSYNADNVIFGLIIAGFTLVFLFLSSYILINNQNQHRIE